MENASKSYFFFTAIHFTFPPSVRAWKAIASRGHTCVFVWPCMAITFHVRTLTGNVHSCRKLFTMLNVERRWHACRKTLKTRPPTRGPCLCQHSREKFAKLIAIDCVHMTSRRPCWRSKQRNGDHVGGVKYSFGDKTLLVTRANTLCIIVLGARFKILYFALFISLTTA